jgi:hypothetical protein
MSANTTTPSPKQPPMFHSVPKTPVKSSRCLIQIAAQIVSMPISFAGSADDLEFGTRVCRKINEGYADLIAKHPARR